MKILLKKKALQTCFFFAAVLFSVCVPIDFVHAATITAPANNLGLVGYWSFNEGAGTTATDFSGNGNEGTLQSSPTWIAGKYGNALNFTGSNSVDLTDQDYFSPSVTDMTISIWARVPVNASSAGNGGSGNTGRNMLAKGVSSPVAQWEWTLENDRNTKFCFSAYTLAGTGRGAVCVDRTMNDGLWHHYLITINDGVEDVVYIDNVEVASITSFSGSMGNGSKEVQIGRRGDGNYFIGDIDEVRIFNRVLSDAEISRLYQAGIVQVKSVNKNGLVGAWNFDEGRGTQAGDISVNGYSGTLNGNTSWVAGRRGTALNFDGNGDYVNLGAPSGLAGLQVPVTITGWFKLSSSGSFRTVYGAYLATSAGRLWSMVRIDSGVLKYYTTISSGSIQSYGTFTPTVGEWHFFSVTVSGSVSSPTISITLDDQTQSSSLAALSSTPNTSVDIYIGGNQSHPTTEGFVGTIDDIKVYNRALSDDEVQGIYKSSATTINTNTTSGSSLESGLVGYWSFNGADLTDKVYDRSGQDNNGTVVGGATSSVKTIGKVGQGVLFDGVNDYITAGTSNTLNASSSITLAVWVKSTFNFSSQTNKMLPIISRMQTSSPYKGYEIGIGGNYLSSDNKAYFHLGGSYSSNVLIGTTSINDGEWHLLVGTYDGTNASIYVDGVAQNSGARTNNLDISGEPFDMGANYNRTAFFTGSGDEMRVYNRALSADEVTQLYNAGK